jgi:hypothetical protein
MFLTELLAELLVEVGAPPGPIPPDFNNWPSPLLAESSAEIERAVEGEMPVGSRRDYIIGPKLLSDASCPASFLTVS